MTVTAVRKDPEKLTLLITAEFEQSLTENVQPLKCVTGRKIGAGRFACGNAACRGERARFERTIAYPGNRESGGQSQADDTG